MLALMFVATFKAGVIIYKYVSYLKNTSKHSGSSVPLWFTDVRSQKNTSNHCFYSVPLWFTDVRSHLHWKKTRMYQYQGFDIQFLHHFALVAKTTCTASFVMIISVSVYAVSVCLTLYTAGFILFSWVLMTWINQHTWQHISGLHPCL